MKREKQAQKIGGQVKDFLKKNPAIKEALRVFDISYDQYQKALESGYDYYTDTSTDDKIIEKFRNIFKREFPKTIKRVYIYFEFVYKNESEYCIDLWKDIDWEVGGIVPMFKTKKKIAFYKITNTYYESGSSMSDWALGDDGKKRDFIFDHIKII